MVAVRGERDELIDQDFVGCFGFLVYCNVCGGRRRIVSRRDVYVATPAFEEGVVNVTLHTACEECRHPQEFGW